MYVPILLDYTGFGINQVKIPVFRDSDRNPSEGFPSLFLWERKRAINLLQKDPWPNPHTVEYAPKHSLHLSFI